MVFHNQNSYLTTLAMIAHHYTFLYSVRLDLYFRRFVSRFSRHSNLGCFIDPGPVGSTLHLWGGFVAWRPADLQYGCSQPLSACSLHFRLPSHAVSSRANVSGRYSFIPLIGLSVLLIKDFVLLLVPVPFQQQERVALRSYSK